MRMMRPMCAVLALAVLAIAEDDPNALLEKAQQAQASRDYDKAIRLLAKADAAWESSSPNVPEHAEALELMALLMKSEARTAAENRHDMGSEMGMEQWRTEAAPVVKLLGPPPKRIGGDVSAPRLLSKKEPDYTESARLSHYSGTALFTVIIDAQGVPTNIRLARGLGYGLDENAAQAISAWRFRPATKDGSPVAVQVNIEVNFRLL